MFKHQIVRRHLLAAETDISKKEPAIEQQLLFVRTRLYLHHCLFPCKSNNGESLVYETGFSHALYIAILWCKDIKTRISLAHFPNMNTGQMNVSF